MIHVVACSTHEVAYVGIAVANYEIYLQRLQARRRPVADIHTSCSTWQWTGNPDGEILPLDIRYHGQREKSYST